MKDPRSSRGLPLAPSLLYVPLWLLKGLRALDGRSIQVARQMNRAENPARRWPTRPEPYCAVAPGRPQSIPLTGVSPACLASGYRHVGQPALYSLDDGQSAASHPSIPQNSLLPAAPFVNPHPPRTGGRSDSDSPYPFPRQVMGQRCEPQGSLFPSFCCYPFESCCHGGCLFSLHRSPFLPLDGAYVTLELAIFRWP